LGVGFALVHLAKKETPESDEGLPFTDKRGGTIIVC
jgi:hypothetical protein